MFTILSQRCLFLDWPVDEDVLRQIAVRGRGVPRIGLKLLEATKRMADSEGEKKVVISHLIKTCELQGLDEHGLGIDDRKYLGILAESTSPVRLNVISTRLDSNPKTVVELIEQYLIRIGFVSKTDKGRFLTDKGRRYLAEM